MPKPRRMQTPVTSPRAIVRLPTLVEEVAGDVDSMWLGDAQQHFTGLSDLIQYGVLVRAADHRERQAMSGKIDGEVEVLVDLARAQDFTVELDGTKLKWTNPEGGSISTPTRVVGRGLNNVKTQLRRLGLEIPNPQKKKQAEVINLTASDEKADPEPAESVISQEISEAYSALHILTEFVAAHQHDDESNEWADLCSQMEVELTLAKEQRDAAESLVNEVRTALTTTAPWQALPAIAALLGITEEKSA